MDYKFYKNNPTDSVWWVDNHETAIGERLFSFNKQQVFNLFADYPHKLTANQKRTFDRENPEWARFFNGRK